MKENILRNLPYLKRIKSRDKDKINEFNNCIIIETILDDDRFEKRFRSVKHISCKVENKVYMFFPLSKEYNKSEYHILYKKVEVYYRLKSTKQTYHIKVDKLNKDLTMFANKSEKLIDSSLEIKCETTLDYKREFSSLIKKETKFIKWIIKILENDIPTKFHRNDRKIFEKFLDLYRKNKRNNISEIIREDLLSVFKIDRKDWEDEVVKKKIGEFILDINILLITKNIDEIKRKYEI